MQDKEHYFYTKDTNETFDTLPNTEVAEDENTITKAIDALTVHLRTRKTLFSKNTSSGKRGKKMTKQSKLTIRV